MSQEAKALSEDRTAALPAVRALRGEASGPVVGVSFLPIEALDPLLWGASHESDQLIARACSQLKLDFAFVPGHESWAPLLARRLNAAGVAPFWVVDGPLSVCIRQKGCMEALRATAEDPLTLADVLDEAVERALDGVRTGRAVTSAALVIAEDLAGANGPLVAPDFVNEMLVSRLAEIVAHAERVRMPVVVHSDGDVRAFMSAFARAGFAAVHLGGLGEAAFVRMLRDAREHGLRTLGGIEGEALRAGLPAAVRAGTQASLFAMAGDLLVADDGSISTPDEFAAYAAAVAAARGEVDE